MEEPPDDAVQDPRENPNIEAMTRWDEVVADMEATADEYRKQNWEVIELHPGDISPIAPDEQNGPGFDIILPNDEFTTFEDYIEEYGFDSIEAFRGGSSEFVYLLLAIKDSTSQNIVLVPAYYQVDEEIRDLFDHAINTGKIDLVLRQLTGEQIVITQQEPQLLAPEEFIEDSEDSN